MTFHFTALLTVTLFGSIAIIFYQVFFTRLHGIRSTELAFMLSCALLIAIRLFLPFEFSFTKTIPITWGLPEFVDFMKSPIITIGGYGLSVNSFLVIIWIIGSFVLLGKTIASYHRFKQRIIESSVPYNAFPWFEANDISHIWEKHENIRILLSSLTDTPIILGYFKPIIVLPMMVLSPHEWELVISHEMNHYMHGDLWVMLAMKMMHIIYWWNPVYYALNQLVIELLEIRNDKKIVSKMSEEEKLLYYNCLLEVAKKRKAKRSLRLALAFQSSKKSVSKRRYQLVDRDRGTYTKKGIAAMITALLFVFFATILSYSIILEPMSLKHLESQNILTISEENSFFIKVSDEQYALYCDGIYLCTIGKKWEDDDKTIGSLALLTIYNSVEEAFKK